jgi:hypothetical protein
MSDSAPCCGRGNAYVSGEPGFCALLTTAGSGYPHLEVVESNITNRRTLPPVAAQTVAARQLAIPGPGLLASSPTAGCLASGGQPRDLPPSSAAEPRRRVVGPGFSQLGSDDSPRIGVLTRRVAVGGSAFQELFR